MAVALLSTGGISFSVGETFLSFVEVEGKLKEYEKVNFVQFWKREARTIEAAKMRIDRYMKPELKYYQLKFCCIHGGKKFKPGGSGIRDTM